MQIHAVELSERLHLIKDLQLGSQVSFHDNETPFPFPSRRRNVRWNWPAAFRVGLTGSSPSDEPLRPTLHFSGAGGSDSTTSAVWNPFGFQRACPAALGAANCSQPMHDAQGVNLSGTDVPSFVDCRE